MGYYAFGNFWVCQKKITIYSLFGSPCTLAAHDKSCANWNWIKNIFELNFCFYRIQPRIKKSYKKLRKKSSDNFRKTTKLGILSKKTLHFLCLCIMVHTQKFKRIMQTYVLFDLHELHNLIWLLWFSWRQIFLLLRCVHCANNAMLTQQTVDWSCPDWYFNHCDGSQSCFYHFVTAFVMSPFLCNTILYQTLQFCRRPLGKITTSYFTSVLNDWKEKNNSVMRLVEII